MSRCDLSIVLEQADGRVAAGSRLAGFVGVVVNKGVNTRGLHIQLVCRTHGRGNKWKEVAHDEVAFVGRWEAGEQQLYPFDFKVPDGPVSYDGELLNVSWFVYAYTDIPWGYDPEVEVEVEVVPGIARHRQGAMASYSDPVPSGKTAVIVAAVTIPFTLAFGSAPWLMFGADSSMPLPVILFLMVWSGLAYGMGGFLVFNLLRNPLARRRLGEFEVAVTPSDLYAGEDVQVTIRHETGNSTHIRSVVAVLKAEEVVVSGSGTNKTTHRHTVVEERKVLLQTGTLPPSGRMEATLKVPPGAPPSFGVSSNRLSWTVEVLVDLPMWPDLTESVPLLVKPGERPDPNRVS